MIINFLFILTIVCYIFYEINLRFQKYKKDIKCFLILFTVVHFSFSLGYAFFLDKLTSIHDPIDYYNDALNSESWMSSFGLGREFMSFLVYPFAQLGISIISLFVFFAAISFKGFLIFFDLLKLNNLERRNYWLLLFYLLPSIHFWTGSLGKEAVLIYLMAIILSKVKIVKIDFKLFLVSLLMFCVRPHLFLVIILAVGLLFAFGKELPVKTKFKIGFSILLLIALLVPVFFVYFLKIDLFNFSSFVAYFDSFLDTTKLLGESKIDLIETNVFTRILYLVFMPLPFLYTLKNNMQYIVAIENVFFLILFFSSIVGILKSKTKWNNFSNDIKFSLISILMIIILFGSYLYNLGLGNRMRAMFLPYLIYFFISVINSKPIVLNK